MMQWFNQKVEIWNLSRSISILWNRAVFIFPIDRIDRHSLVRCWSIEIPKVKNWSRFVVMTPFFTFNVTGWLFWGTKPK